MTEDLTRGSGELSHQAEQTTTENATELSASAASETLSGQATTSVSPPPAGQTVVFQPQAGDRFALNANPADVRILIEGNDVILAFDTNGDGTPDSSAVFENLVNVAQGDNPPVVVVGNQPIAANVLIGGVLALAGEEATVETAADAGAEGTGGTQYNDDLGDVIDLLVAQGIIPPTALEFGLIERIDPTAIDLAEGELRVRFETEIHGRTFGGGFEDGQPFQNICKPGVYPMQIVVEFDPNDNETLETLKISGFPKGSVILLGGSDPLDPNVTIIDVASEPFELVLTDAAGHFVFDGTNWVVKGGLFMLPPPDADNDIPLHFEASIEDPDSGDTATLNLDTTAIIDAVADKPAAWFEGKGIFQVDGPELHKMDFGYGKANFGDGYYQENGLKLIADWGDEFHIANFTGSGPIWCGERELKIGDGDLEDAYVLCPKYDDCMNLISLDLQDCTTTDLVFISSEGAVFVIPAGSEPGTYHFPDGFQNVDFVKFYGEELDGKNASVIDNIKFSLACDCEPKEFKVCYLEDNAHPDGCRDGCLTDGDPKYAIGAKFKVTDKDGSEGITKLTFCLEDKIDNDGQIHAPWVPDGNNVDDIEALGPYGESTTFMSIGGDKVTEGEVFCLWAKVFNASEGEIQGIGAGEFGWAKVEATAHFLYGKLVLDFEQDCNDGLHIQSVSLTHGQLLEVHLPQHADDDFTVKATVKVEENPTDEELVEWNNSSKQTTEIDVIVKAVADGAEISFKDYTKGKECERHDLDLRKGGLYATWGEDITVTAFDKHGDPAKVFFDHGTGIGVVSFGDGGSGGRFDEINSVGNDKSEGLCFEFDSPVTDAKFELSAFYKGEPGVGNEQGEWTAYLNGCEVASDCFTANRTDGDFELKLPDDLIFDKIVFTAEPGTSDGQEGDSSDYYVQKVCYEELLPGLCYFEETTTEGECCDEIPLLKLDWAEDGEGSPKDHGPNGDENSLIVPVKFQAALIDEDGSESVTKVKLSLCEADCNAEWVNKWGNELCEGDTVWFDNGFKGKVVYIDGDDLVISFDYDQSANNGKDFCLDGEIGVKLPIDDSNDFQIKIGVTTSETHDDNWGAGDKSCTTEAIIDVDVKGVVGPAKTSFGDYAECRECHRGDAYVDQRDPSKGHWGNDITVKVYDKFGIPATLFVGSDGLGVESGTDGGSGNRFNEINYVGHGKSESMELCFDFPVTDVKFELSAFYKNEGGVGDEQGEWTAYLHGEEVGEGCFTADSSSGSYELDLGHLTFDKIVFKALPGNYDYPQGDSSDYYIEKVCYEKPIDGLCEVSTTEKWVDGKKVEALKLVWAEDGEGNPSEHGANACEDPLCIPIQFKAETQDDDGSQKSEAITKIVLEENSCGEFVVKGECDGQVEIQAQNQLGQWFTAIATVTHYDGKLILEFEDIDCVPQLVNKVDLGGVVDVKLPIDDSNDFCVEIKTTTREYDDDNFDKDGNWTGYNYDAEVKVAETSVKDYIDIEIKGVVGPAATSFNYDECKVCADEVYLSDNAKTGLWGHDIKIAAFDKYGNPAKIVDSAHGLGVESNNDGGSSGRYDEINYDDVANKSESLVLNFCGKVTGVKVELSAFYKNEGGVGDERGQYELYLNGEKVGEGCFEANSSSGDYCLDLGDASFDKIVFKGREGDEDGYDGDSSDYYVKEVCYTPVYEGLCEVGEGECLVDCPIEVDAQVVDGGGNYEFGLYLQTPPLGDHLADTVILVHLPPGYSVAEGHGTHSLWDPETNIVEFRADQLIGQGRLNWTIQLNGPCEPNPDDFLIETFKSVPALQTTWAEDGTADPCDHGANACEDPLCIPVEFRAKTQDDDGKQQSEAITKIVLHEDGDGHFAVEGCNDGKLEILAVGLDGEVFTAIAHVSQDDGKLVLEFKDIYGKPQLVQEVDLSCAVKLVHPIDDSTDYCLKIETTTTEYDDDSFYDNGSWKSYVGDDDVKVEEFTKTDMLSVEIKGVVGKAIVQLKGERIFFEDGAEVCETVTQCPEDLFLGKGQSTGTWGPDIEIFGRDENGDPASLHVDSDGVGVASSNDGGSGVRFDELQHTGEGVFGTESIVLKFDCPVSSAKVELSEFFSNENGVGDEQGGWIAFLDGDYVGSDVFTANSGGGDFCLDLGNLIFDKLLFVGIQGTNDPDGVGNSNSDSSDYNIKSVTYGKVVCCQDPEDGPLKLPVEVCVATQDTDGSEGVLAINLVLGGCEQETLRGFQFLGSNCQPVCEGDTFEAKGYTYDDYGNLTGETCITLEACAIEGGWLLKVVPDHNTPFDGWDKIVLNEGEIFVQPPQNFNGDFDLTISGHLKEFDDDLDGGKYGKDLKVTEETVTYKVVPLNDAPEADDVDTKAECAHGELPDCVQSVLDHLGGQNGQNGQHQGKSEIALYKVLNVNFGEYEVGDKDWQDADLGAYDPEADAEVCQTGTDCDPKDLDFKLTSHPEIGTVYRVDEYGNVCKLEIGQKFDIADKLVWIVTEEELEVCFDPGDVSVDSWIGQLEALGGHFKGYDINGNPTDALGLKTISVEGVTYTGIGVNAAGGRDQETDYLNQQQAESLEVCFDENLTCATITLGTHFDGVNFDNGNVEVAEWLAYDNGVLVSSGTVLGSLNGLVEFTVDAKFDKLVLNPLDNGAGQNGNNSDFVLVSIKGVKDIGDKVTFDYSVEDCGDCIDTGTVTLHLPIFVSLTGHPVVYEQAILDAINEQNPTEPSLACFQLQLSEPASDTVTVKIQVGNGGDSADGASDYWGTDGNHVWVGEIGSLTQVQIVDGHIEVEVPAGSETINLYVECRDDLEDEGDNTVEAGEKFTLQIVDVTGGGQYEKLCINPVEGKDSAEGIIVDNDVRNSLPQAVDDEKTVSESTSQETVNIMVVFDRSGSMGDDPNVDGFSDRIDLARAAVANMLEVAGQQYSAVNVLVVDFSGSADNSGWTSIAGANSYLTLLDPSGNTDYQDAIAEATAAFNSGTPAADRNLTFFLSDGNPDPSNLQLTAGQQGDWETFLAGHDMPAYAVGVGTGVTATGLDPVAHDPDGGPADDPIVLTDEGDLIPTLVNILGATVGGNLLANDNFGGDGQAVPPIAGVTYNNAASTGFGSGFVTSSLAAAGLITITGSIGGDDYWVLTVDREGADAGDYELTVLRDLPQAAVGGTGHLVFDYFIEDGTGDLAAAQLDIGVIDATETVTPLELIAGDDGENNLNGNGNSEILGGDGDNDNLEAGGESDFLYGGNSGDVLRGQGGDDYLVGGSGDDELRGGNGDDVLNGGFGNDVLNGGDGDDYLDGGSGDNVLNGDSGDDILIWDSPGDEYNGNGGFDTLVIANGADIDVDGDLVDNIASIEAIDMRNGADNGLGDSGPINAADVISMTDGDNELFILGDAGDDSVNLTDNLVAGAAGTLNAGASGNPFASISFEIYSDNGATVYIQSGLDVV